jgi:anti-anti-sigma regulatory factor
MAWRRMSQSTLRITTNETGEWVAITLEGRVAGLWATELNLVWAEAAPRLATRKLILDLRNVTYADIFGKRVLRDIYSRTEARIIASTPWTQYLAEEISGRNSTQVEEEAGNANDE